MPVTVCAELDDIDIGICEGGVLFDMDRPKIENEFGSIFSVLCQLWFIV